MFGSQIGVCTRHTGSIKRQRRQAGEGACPAVKNIGKTCAGKPHARFDEGGMVEAVMVRIMRRRRTKGAETDRPNLKPHIPSLYSTLLRPTTRLVKEGKKTVIRTVCAMCDV